MRVKLNGYVLAKRDGRDVVLDRDIGGAGGHVPVYIGDSQGNGIACYVRAGEGIRRNRKAGDATGVVGAIVHVLRCDRGCAVRV